MHCSSYYRTSQYLSLLVDVLVSVSGSHYSSSEKYTNAKSEAACILMI